MRLGFDNAMTHPFEIVVVEDLDFGKLSFQCSDTVGERGVIHPASIRQKRVAISKSLGEKVA
jgi:hypothetical protein